MTGGSLGYRSLSNGALQQNGIHSFSTRRSSKGSISGARDKERLFPWLWKHLGRTDVGMLILVTFALVAFMTGWFRVNKEDTSGGSGLDFVARLRHQTYIPQRVPREAERHYDVCSENNGTPSFSNFSGGMHALSSAAVLNHPCKNFAIPPPPPGYKRRIGPRPCPVCYIPVEQAIASMPKFPSKPAVLHHLTYFREKDLIKTAAQGGSDFGGYLSLKQRNDSFDIKESMTVHCGFVKGCRPGEGTGFDIDDAVLTELKQFHEVIVASAIFANYDIIQQPTNISEFARSSIPFYMFIDEETEAYMKNSSLFDSDRRVGLWRIVVVRNLPYADARRNGKVPKLLLHRLFPNVRYSIWIDGKLKLVVDPYQVLERFLWRQNASFAISRHYKRFDVFEEAEANKAGGKYDNVSIDSQIDFYRKEGLTPYTRAKLPITSDVPEGCVIIREHIPITNLFTCLWFNEVDRFTSRDQLSFSTVRDKLMAKVNWSINMFLDCERRNFVIQAYHRDLLEQRARLALARSRLSPPPVRDNRASKTPVKKISIKRGKGGKRSGSRRHRKVVPGEGDNLLL